MTEHNKAVDDAGANAKRFRGVSQTKPAPTTPVKDLITRLDLVTTSVTKMEKKEKIYPKGIRTFAPNGNAPEFILGSMVITPNELFEWLKTQKEYSSEYNGNIQFRFTILEGKEDENGLKSPYIVLDTFKPTTKKDVQDNVQDLPF